MALDQSKVGQVVAQQMEALEADYGDDCEIGDVCTIVEIVGPHRIARARPATRRAPMRIIGLLRVAETSVLGSYGPGDDGEDDLGEED